MVAKGLISTNFVVRPNKKISVFQVTGPKILGRVAHIFFQLLFCLEKKLLLCINYIFSRKPEKKSRFHQ